MGADRDWIRRAEKGPGTAGGPERTRTAYFYNPAFHPYGRSWGALVVGKGCGPSPSPTPSCIPLPTPDASGVIPSLVAPSPRRLGRDRAGVLPADADADPVGERAAVGGADTDTRTDADADADAHAGADADAHAHPDATADAGAARSVASGPRSTSIGAMDDVIAITDLDGPARPADDPRAARLDGPRRRALGGAWGRTAPARPRCCPSPA